MGRTGAFEHRPALLPATTPEWHLTPADPALCSSAGTTRRAFTWATPGNGTARRGHSWLKPGPRLAPATPSPFTPDTAGCSCSAATTEPRETTLGSGRATPGCCCQSAVRLFATAT